MEKNTSLKVGDKLRYKGFTCDVIEVHSTYACLQTQEKDSYTNIKRKFIISLFVNKMEPIDYTKETVNE